jgi:hypothetical protein
MFVTRLSLSIRSKRDNRKLAAATRPKKAAQSLGPEARFRRQHMASIKVTVSLCLVFCMLTACKPHDSAPPPTTARMDDGQVFQRKVECGKFLAHVEGSLTGPDVHPQKGIANLNPIVFYSPRLNTCLLISRFITSGQTVVAPVRKYRVEYASVEDLLTGRTVEGPTEFDLEVPQQRDASNKYEDQVLNQYGVR